MGYHTEFSGSIDIVPPLNAEETAFLQKFNETRRMYCVEGPYYVDRGGHSGQDREPGVRDYNSPPLGQPGLWCQWRPSDDGTELEWDGGEKFYDSVLWMAYVIDHFLKPGCLAATQLPFLQANHICNGEIEAQGEERGDRWKLVVKDNVVRSYDGHVVYEDEQD